MWNVRAWFSLELRHAACPNTGVPKTPSPARVPVPWHPGQRLARGRKTCGQVKQDWINKKIAKKIAFLK